MRRDHIPASSSTAPILLRLLIAIQLLVDVTHIRPTACAIVDAENCWNDSEKKCIIHATLHRADEPLHSDGLIMEIDCEIKAEAQTIRAPAFFLRRLENAESLLLDGCHSQLGVETYGMEYLPNCDTVSKVYMERFHADTLRPFQCPSANNSELLVEVLRYRNNELGTIGAEAFGNLPHLREVYFERNALRHITPAAFDALRVVERICIFDEPLLALKDGALFERTGVADLQLVQLKHITSHLFTCLPETLRQILITRTTFDNGSVTVSNPQLLRNISITDCALKSFTLLENAQTVSVEHINLSGNALIHFHVDFLRDVGAAVVNAGNTTIAALKTLDLSRNELTELPLSWLSGLRKLCHLFLHDNRLLTLSVSPLMSAIPSMAFLDLHGNQLQTLTVTADKIEHHQSAFSWEQVRIRIDHNPWSCLWLLEFAHTYPEKFRVFQYEKFISQINVNGLKCVPVEEDMNESAPDWSVATSARSNNIKIQVHEPHRHTINASTYKLIYGGPWEYKRNQRAEALVIVFMLPVGVALLFTLLYMWINCQKLFHLSFYRSISWPQRYAGGRFRSAERFDFVRQLPPMANNTLNANANTNNNHGYEAPLNGIASVCNCQDIGGTPPTYANEKCDKLRHITYEELPSEQPYKIYEEIIDDDATDTEAYTQPFYDHLSFKQPAPRQI